MAFISEHDCVRYPSTKTIYLASQCTHSGTPCPFLNLEPLEERTPSAAPEDYDGDDEMDGSDSAQDSPLSDHPSSEFGDDVLPTPDRNASEDMEEHEHADNADMPPAKKQRIGQYGYRATPVMAANYDDGEISSDTDGSVPGSPWPSGITPDDNDVHEQVTLCKWLNCTAGDLGNMDNLVQHIHDDHIGIRQKKYACEWEGCPRIGMNHASGYALRAHMRSHTKEKPFFCALPECDKSFTRSDALAKHMRTVHETEALRPSDPVPRSHSTAGMKPQRLKLIINAKPPALTSHSSQAGEADIDDDATIGTHPDSDNDPSADSEADAPLPLGEFQYPPDVEFTDEEKAMPIDELYKLLRMQVHWSEESGAELRKEVAELEGKRKEAWQAKELVLHNLYEAELANADAKGEEQKVVYDLATDLPAKVLPMKGPTPWWRELREEEVRDVEG